MKIVILQPIMDALRDFHGDLYDLVFSDREVMAILDAYKKAVDARQWEDKKFGRAD